MSDNPRRGWHALIIAVGILATIGGTAGMLYTDWQDAQPKPIDRTATRWATGIAEQDAESRRNNDPDYKAPNFDDPNHKGPYKVHPNTWHRDHPNAQRP